MLMPLVVGKAQAEKVLSVGRPETSQASFMKADGIFLLVSRSGSAWESPQWLPQAGVDVAPYPILQILGFFPWVVVLTGGDSGTSFASGMVTPQKTSSSVKGRYHLTSFLSSSTLSTNTWGLPPVGGSFCSAQYWRALAYTTTFSLGTSLMSWLAKIELACSINLCQ